MCCVRRCPESTLVDCGKGGLLLAADPGAGPVAAAVVAYPWHSLATLRALRRRQPRAVLVVSTGAHDAATHAALLATKVAAVIADSAPPAIVGAVVQVALHGDASVQARALWQRIDPAEEDDRPQRRLGELNLTPRQFDVLRLVASGQLQQGDRGRTRHRPAHGERPRRSHPACAARGRPARRRAQRTPLAGATPDVGAHRRRRVVKVPGRRPFDGPSVRHPLGTGPHTRIDPSEPGVKFNSLRYATTYRGVPCAVAF